MKSVLRYFKGVGREAKRIKWPDRETFIPSMVVVICIAIFAGIFLSLEDLATATILEQLRNAFESI